MAPIENDPVCADEDLDDDDDDESEQEEYLVAPAKRLDEIDENDDEDPDQDHNDTSSSNLASASPSSSPQLTLAVSIAADPVSPLQTVASAAIALPVTDSSPDFKRQRIDTLAIPGINNTALKPLAVFDESRRLFQRLWTDEDEIELLQGFLDYTKKQRFNSGSGNAYHHDTSAFYDQIKSKLQLDFNKNQLVEKLRRLKKKYRTIISKMGSGKEYVFKSSHDQATFEICKKIWSTDGRNNNRVGGGGGGLEDDDTNPNPNPNPNPIHNRHNNSVFAYCSGKKSGGSGKRFRGGSVKMQDVKPQFHHQLTTPMATPIVTGRDPSPIPCLIEETVRSCLPPLLKDLLQNCGGSSSRGGVGGIGINSLPFGLLVGGNLNSLSGSGGGGGGDVMEEKWRKQQIMELEVYSKRLELVQDEIKSALDELRRSSMLQQHQQQQQGGAS